MGCTSQKVNGVERALSPEEIARLGCRPGDEIDQALVADTTAPPPFKRAGGTDYLRRAPTNLPQHQHRVVGRVADLRLRRALAGARQARPERSGQAAHGGPARRDHRGRPAGLPADCSSPADPMNPDWAGQEATGVPGQLDDRDELLPQRVRARAQPVRRRSSAARPRQTPDDDSGLRDPANPDRVIRYRDVTPDELFEVARLVVAAEIAKIHTIEWTTQLLYDEPLFRGMNANWRGLFARGQLGVSSALEHVVSQACGVRGPASQGIRRWYSDPGIGPRDLRHRAAEGRAGASPIRMT